ncbi:FUSC family protein [Azorhizobium oxalatiphilum]|nr:aromatic acid exporter family protein [Azorhizobium oxalatiphilum]
MAAAIVGLQLALRVAISAAITLPIAKALHFEQPVYAFVAAVIVTDLSPKISRHLGLIRIAATLVGAAIGMALSLAFGAGLYTVGVGVFASMVMCQLLNVADGAKVAGYIAGLILFDHLGDAWTYAMDRILETLLGVFVAWGVSLVPKLVNYDRVDPAP